MLWSEPLYSKSATDRAARVLVDAAASNADREAALVVVNNWRSSHAFPLNTMQVSLRRRARAIDEDATVSQRIKRLPSITQKIERYPDMRLSRMQDIGGCRAIFSDVAAVRAALAGYRAGNGKHELIRLDDYIDVKPKDSGYRGIHLVYKYKSDRTTTYNGQSIEIQLRSRLQHAWATAVEAVGFFTDQALKSSSGNDDWLRFFALMSSEIAHREETPIIPGTPISEADLLEEIRELAHSLNVIERLTAYGQTLKVAEEHIAGRGHKYFVLSLNAGRGSLAVFTFGALDAATDFYEAREKESAHDGDTDVVLVSVDSLAALRRAYPNYFLDTEFFLGLVTDAIER